MEPSLIHADGQLYELARINEFESFSASVSLSPGDGCDWELIMPSGAWSRCPVEAGHYIYIENSEWGGPVEQVRHVSADGRITLKGTCWRGLLSRKVISPPDGSTHFLLAQTEANAAIAALTEGWRSDLFTVSGEDSGLFCSASLRYAPLLEALDDMLAAAGGRLSAVFSGGKVLLRAVASRDMSEEVELSQEYDARLRTDSTVRLYDHIIALGRGEMLDRQVVELWLRTDGTVTDDPTQAAGQESTLLYDYPAVETPEELEQAARRKLLSHAEQNSMEIEMTDNVGLELTDTAAVRDTLTGMTAMLKVTAQELSVRSSGITLVHRLKQ